jgi:hypothetical protein
MKVAGNGWKWVYTPFPDTPKKKKMGFSGFVNL